MKVQIIDVLCLQENKNISNQIGCRNEHAWYFNAENRVDKKDDPFHTGVCIVIRNALEIA